MRSCKFAVLVSGYGRGAIEIIKDYKFKLIKPTLSLVLSTTEESHALKVANSHEIATEVVRPTNFESHKHFEECIVSALQKHRIEYVFLAGYMKIVKEFFLQHFEGKIVNIHPSLLPSFKGLHAIDQAIQAKVRITGVTTHWVDSTIDGGEIIDQRAVRISSSDDFSSIDNKIFKIGTLLTTDTINKVFV